MYINLILGYMSKKNQRTKKTAIMLFGLHKQARKKCSKCSFWLCPKIAFTVLFICIFTRFKVRYLAFPYVSWHNSAALTAYNVLV